MIRQCFSSLSSLSFLYSLFAVVFSVLITLGAEPVVAADGDLDTSFDGDGKVLTDFGSGSVEEARSVAIQSDGKIVVAGIRIEPPIKGGSSWRFALARYNVNGSLDTSFGEGGKVTTAISGFIDEAYSVAIQPDGKIVVAGYSNGSNEDFALVRYNTDGTLDNSFDSDGKVTTEHGSGWGIAYSVAIQSDGKIVAAGHVQDAGAALVRYNTDGALDNSFGTDGKVYPPFDDTGPDSVAYSVAIQSDGKIVAAGSSSNDFAVARYNTNGTLDTNFGSRGMVTTAIGSGRDIARSVAIQSNGKIVAAGWSENGSNTDFALARYNTDGTLDNSFGSDGKVTTEHGSGSAYAYSVAIQSDGKIVAAGYSGSGSDSNFALVRYNTDGSLDNSFDGDGKVTSAIGSGSGVALSVAIQSNGKIVAVGWSQAQPRSDADFALVRFVGTYLAPPTPVPTLPLFGLGILVSLLGLFGLRKLRQ